MVSSLRNQDSHRRGQILGYDGCYDSGICPHGYLNSFPKIFYKGSNRLGLFASLIK